MGDLVHMSLDHGIGRLVLNHPPLNILTRAVLAQMREALTRLEGQPEVRVLLLSATGKHFSAGADVPEHLPPSYQDLIPEFMSTLESIATFPLPVVAAVQGRCLGGGFEVVQAADIVVAGETSSFGQPEIVLGVFPPAACVLLPERGHPSVAAEVVLTGDAISARRAAAAGFVNHVMPDEDVESRATAIAERIARHSAAALRLAKRGLDLGGTSERSAKFQRATTLYTDDLMGTEDAVEGLRAFTEKRQPSWSHR